VNDENRLDEKLQVLGAAVSHAPSLRDDVMRRIEDAPEPVRRRSRRKVIAAACLAAAACVAASVIGWMAMRGDDTTETASLDAAQTGVQPEEAKEGRTTGHFGLELSEHEGMGEAKAGAEGFERGREAAATCCSSVSCPSTRRERPNPEIPRRRSC
jgi:hypothetical protein